MDIVLHGISFMYFDFNFRTTSSFCAFQSRATKTSTLHSSYIRFSFSAWLAFSQSQLRIGLIIQSQFVTAQMVSAQYSCSTTKNNLYNILFCF